MAKKSAISGEYIITQEDNGSIRVCQIFDNVIGSLRAAAAAVKFAYDKNWNTQQFGNKLVKEFGDGVTANIDEYTIVRRGNGSIESYRVHGNTIKVLREIGENAGYPYQDGWNTRQYGSRLIDHVNGDMDPADDEPVEDGLVIDPAMTVQQLSDAFKALFGGHLRIKKGNRRCDAFRSSTDGVEHEVLDATLSEIGCTAGGVFSGDLTVGEFVKKAKEECGLSVVVATNDDWVAALDGFTLDFVGQIPNNTTKQKMQEILDR